MTTSNQDDYDSPWKEALERYLPDFLALLFPQVYAGIDWAQGHEFLDTELHQVVRDAALGRRLADKLVRVVDLFGHEGWGCEVGIRFPSVKLLDYRARWAELEASANPFAVVVQAHLITQETRHAPQKRYRAKLVLAKSLYRRGWERGDILELFRFTDWMLRLPEELEEQLWSEIQTYETVEHMPYVTSVERIGIRKGMQQGIEQATREGLQHQRHMLTGLVQRRFGADVAKDSGPLLARIVDPQRLDDLTEVVLDSPDGEAWLTALRQAAD